MRNQKIIRLFFLMNMMMLSFINRCRCQVVSYTKTNFGISCSLKKGLLNIYILKDDVAEVRFTSLTGLEKKPSLVVLPVSSYNKTFTVSADDKNKIVITTAKLKITINKSNNAIAYYDVHNALILSEAETNKTMADTTIAGIKIFSCSASFSSPEDEALLA